MRGLRLSRTGARYAGHSGTRTLMDDLGEVARRPGDFLNLGGGNPARVPEMHAFFSDRLASLATAHALDSAFAGYEDPQGAQDFRAAFAGYLARRWGWPVSADNILCTAGSQASFFMLFNLLAGEDEDGRRRHILFPQAPEYIGYANLALTDGALRGTLPRPRETGRHRFRYDLEVDALRLGEDTAALCLSRPANPTGSVCRAPELRHLLARAERVGIPLIVDCAYGEPFPGIVAERHDLPWSPGLIACFSLSKLGLPGLRTGILVGPTPLVRVLTNLSAAMVLSTDPIGTSLARTLFETDEIDSYVRDCIQPFYAEKRGFAVECCERQLAGLDYSLHEPEGAIFLWLWLRGLPITAEALYGRLKQRGVLVIPGLHFAPGMETVPAHLHECLRLSFAQPAEVVEKGIAILAEEVRRAYAEG